VDGNLLWAARYSVDYRKARRWYQHFLCRSQTSNAFQVDLVLAVIHVCLKVRPDIYIENRGLHPQVREWIEEACGNGRPALSMTELNWGKSKYYYHTSSNPGDPRYTSLDQNISYRDIAPRYLHFLFKDETLATLFKLAWGGQ